MGAPEKNTNAAKNERAETWLQVRLTQREKSRWVRAAQPGTLATFVRAACNTAAARIEEDRRK